MNTELSILACHPQVFPPTFPLQLKNGHIKNHFDIQRGNIQPKQQAEFIIEGFTMVVFTVTLELNVSPAGGFPFFTLRISQETTMAQMSFQLPELLSSPLLEHTHPL